MGYEFGNLEHKMRCPVLDGTIQVSPSEMLFLVRRHRLQFFVPGDTLTLRYKNHKVITCVCEDYAWYWRLMFWLRLPWHLFLGRWVSNARR